MNTILTYIFNYLNLIILVIWFLILILITVRFLRPNWVKNFSYFKFALIVSGLRIFYVLFITWGQYYVWSITDKTGTFIKMPYFLGYVFTNFWLDILMLFATAMILYGIFKTWQFYRGGFSEGGPILLLSLMLISGWPGIFVCVILGFILAILLILFYHLKGYIKKIPVGSVPIEGAFIVSAFIATLFTGIIMRFF